MMPKGFQVKPRETDSEGRVKCIRCYAFRPLNEFREKKKSPGVRERVCKPCNTDRASAQERLKLDQSKAYSSYRSSKNYDLRRFKRYPDLTIEQIETLFKLPCIYCDRNDQRMTLDRIDCAKPHDISNVLPSCSRCNVFRRDMPFAGWLKVAKAIKECDKLGYFDGWNPGDRFLESWVKAGRKIKYERLTKGEVK